jgi:hypothetical protein
MFSHERSIQNFSKLLPASFPKILTPILEGNSKFVLVLN